ncbi:extracellular ligand-binding receptor [Cupriavidus sp. GA3-3]|nr:extracellular ligand-binding receptor [Cupriavidus sp. GA3-3]
MLAAAAFSLLAGAAVAAPVKIALVETLSGPQASTGLMFRAATRYGIDKINAAGGWNGEPLQLLEYDNQGGPAGAADKLKAAIADGAQIVIQGSSSAVSGQITEDVRKFNLRNPGKEILYLNAGGEALELTGEKCHFYHFRFATNAQIRVKALVSAMKPLNALGTREYSINQNYSWGIDMEKAIADYASAGGYAVVEKTLHDVNKVQDFSPYVAKIAAARADTVITGNWSNDLLLLMKATKAAGLKTRFATVFLDQPGNLGNAGDVALGHYVAHPFNPEAGGAEGERLANDFKAKEGHMPVFIEPQTIFAMQMLGEALKSVKPDNGKLGTRTLALALESAKIKTSQGELSMRAADHQVQLPMVVSVVSKDARFKVDGTSMGFKPIKTFTAAEASTPPQASCKMQRPV